MRRLVQTDEAGLEWPGPAGTAWAPWRRHNVTRSLSGRAVVVLALGALLAGSLGLHALVLYPRLHVGVLYTLPVLLAAWLLGPRLALGFATLALVGNGLDAWMDRTSAVNWAAESVAIALIAGLGIRAAAQSRAIARLAAENGRLVEDLRAVLRVRDEFLSLAAHELRTPLTILKGYTGHLRQRGAHDAEEGRILQRIDAQGDRMIRLVQSLEGALRIQNGKLPLHRDRLDLGELARQVARTVQAGLPDHQLTVSGDEPVVVWADRARIGEVLLNLLDNAVKYSPRGGPIEVVVQARAAEAIVSVRDHGVGIPEKKQGQLFEAFYQAAPMVRPTTGMGLGLYISREIVQRHGGRIWFKSQEGQGSTFSFSLPLLVSGSTGESVMSHRSRQRSSQRN